MLMPRKMRRMVALRTLANFVTAGCEMLARAAQAAGPVAVGLKTAAASRGNEDSSPG
jgi:hypothetical protein